MKKVICVLAVIVMCIGLYGCGGGGSSYSGSYDSDSDSGNSYSGGGKTYKDHDGDGEYSFSDYLQDEAPDLYDDIKDRYESLQ